MEEISGPQVAGRVRVCADAVRTLSIDSPSAVVLLSSHGSGPGVYAGRTGNLDPFGGGHVAVETTAAGDLADELRRTWGAPALGAHLDHGIVVPLALGLAPGVPVVAAVVTSVSDGDALAGAISAVADHRTTRIAVVASAHTGAGLTERAPLALQPDAVALEDEILESLTRDTGVLRRHADELARLGSCGAAPLATVGALFDGRPSEVAAYERSFGVGYLVASVRV